jgi:ComF family protein
MLQQLASLAWTMLGDVVSPCKCAACDARLSSHALLCPLCASTVERWHGTDPPWAFGHYGGALASALLRLKYANRPDLGAPIGALLRDRLVNTPECGNLDVVVPVPVPYGRLVDRGYNQAALIANPIARAFGVPMAARALARVDGGAKQASLGRRERLENLRDAFWVRAPRSVAGRRVLLVDDVSTTGATMGACRDTLLAAGARSVDVAVVARTDAPGGWMGLDDSHG